MPRCIYCNIEIDKTNESWEHILPNGIGGMLKSKRLVCNQCNSSFGKEIDNELVNQLNHIVSMLNIKRDRGTPQWIKAEPKEENISYYLEPGGKPVLDKPVVKREINGEKIKINIIARNISEARKILKGIKRKYPKLDVEQILKQAKRQQEYLDDYLHFKFSIGGTRTFRAVAKIAYNYYRYKNQADDSSYFNDIVKYIKGELPDRDYVWFYYRNGEVIDKQLNEVLHSIAIKGNNNDHCLYAYVELFNAFKFIILLSNNYIGNDCKEVYNFDLVNRNEVTRDVNIDLSLEEIANLVSEKPRFETFLKVEYEKLFPIIINKQLQKHSEELIEKAMKNSFMKYPEGTTITEKMINEFIQEIMKGITPLIVRQAKRKIKE